MLDDTALALIVRYVSGECTPEEMAAVERWIAEDPARARTAERLDRLWRAGADLRDSEVSESLDWDVDAAWRRVTEPARPVRTLRLLPIDAAISRRRRWIRLAAAAAAIAMVTSSVLLWWMPGIGRPSDATVATASAGREFATAPAQRAEVRLGDGTRAVIAPASRLRIPDGYGVTTRELQLEGEAYFEVRPDSARPFRVRTARGLVEDIGTKFAVRSYAADSTELVAVTEGIVLLHAADTNAPPAKLVAGQLGVRAPSGERSVRTVHDIDRYVAWTEGRLVFRDAPLGEVAAQLGRWYALDVRLGDRALGELVFTGSFRDESVAEVLRSLEIALDLRVRRTGDVVTLVSNPSRR